MSALLIISGTKLDVLALRAILPKNGTKFNINKQQANEKELKSNSPSSINLVLSRKGFRNLEGQIKDTISYIEKNSPWLHKAVECTGVDEAYISFACEKEITPASFYYFPHDLLRTVGNIGLGIRLSLFYCSAD